MKDTRERLGLTQQRLAHRLGCAVRTVHRHEHRPELTTGRWLLALKQIEVEGVINGIGQSEGSTTQT